MKILFIPHIPETGLINRVYELADQLGGYKLIWKMEGGNWGNKVKSQLSSLLRRVKVTGRWVEMPLLFRPEKWAPLFNTYLLNRVVKELGVDVVVNGNALLFDISAVEVPVIYDLVDDHLTPNSKIGLTPRRVGKIVWDIRHSAGVVAVSTLLEEKVKKFNPHTTTIENGLYLERFTSARSLKRELGLEGKIVFGYIGGVSSWTQLHRGIGEYLKIASDETAFLVVGGDNRSYYRQLVGKYGEKVHFVGAVPPPQVPNYFKTLDIGLIPFEVNDFTSNAFPIKSLEYGAGGAYVLSTPLNYLQSKKFPFIQFAPIGEFATQMERLKIQLPTLPSPSQIFDFSEYDWKKLGRKLKKFLKSI